jgi:uncharacterized protein (DUF1800 family)
MKDLFGKSVSRREFLRFNMAAFAALAVSSPLYVPLIQRIGKSAGLIGENIYPESQTNSAVPESSRVYSPLTLLAANRLTFGPRQEDLVWIETNGVDAFIDQQLAFENIDDSALAPRLQSLDTLNQTSGSPFPVNAADALAQLQQATLLRAVYSKRQLFELMVDFWTNHFNININSLSNSILKTVDDRDVIRNHSLGSFRDLLGSSAHSPAMLGSYNINSRFGLKPNEYYARELLEMQTIGLNGGYTELDISEIARAFTGWMVATSVNGKPIIHVFNFLSANHDWGIKNVLGHVLPANGGGNGEKDGENVLDILTANPACASLISFKLAQRFISDNPPASVVQTGANTFQRSHGDIRTTLSAILHSPEFKNSSGLKMKRPFEYIASVLRILNAETDAGSSLQGYIQNMGQPLFLWDKPGGYPDTADAWMNAGDILARWNFAKAIANNSINGTQIDLSGLVSQPGDIVANLAQAILARTLPVDVATGLKPLAVNKNATELVALLIGSPFFQFRS